MYTQQEPSFENSLDMPKHEHMNAVISSLQLDFCPLTDAFIITNSANMV